ncbi:hypothetical protein BKA70DRAFT_1438683 [Coprinopsis sp. MPI-PUGE-AT-0042]|nr:hypothetical protein BKA70DRAFT_1438683 [Coprinopsis sp. MPI-PUGE-AT-0042]
MVYLPPQSVRTARVGRLLARVHPVPKTEGISTTACIMEYDGSVAGMKPWYWPSTSDGMRVPPDELNEYTNTHFFMPPSCGYVVILVCDATTSLISVTAKSSRVILERFYSAKLLLVKAYPEREVPLRSDMWDFMRDDSSSDTQKGFLQLLPDVSNQEYLRTSYGSRRLLQRQPGGLSEQDAASDSKVVATSKTDLHSLTTSSLSEDRFWNLFVQCLRCKDVMPRHASSAVSHNCLALEGLRRRVDRRKQRGVRQAAHPERNRGRTVIEIQDDGREVIVILDDEED